MPLCASCIGPIDLLGLEQQNGRRAGSISMIEQNISESFRISIMTHHKQLYGIILIMNS